MWMLVSKRCADKKETANGLTTGEQPTVTLLHNRWEYSCLENPMDKGAWWATVHRVPENWTWLKRLSMHAQRALRGFPGGTNGKEPAWQCRRHRDAGSIPGSEWSPGGEHGNPLQHSCLKNPMDRGAWQAIVHRVTKSWTWLKWLSTHP